MALDTLVPIGRVKRDISDLVNRVAYRGERIILTSRGKPKAALVSIEDYERLKREQTKNNLAHWRAWVAQADALAAEVLTRRGGVPISVDDLVYQEREDLEARSDWVTGSN
jgi:prevent-host-death family protein